MADRRKCNANINGRNCFSECTLYVDTLISNEPFKTDPYFQTASIGAFGLGTSLAWTSPALPRMQDDLCLADCDVPGITVDEASWIGAMLPLGAVLSGPIAGGEIRENQLRSYPKFRGYRNYVVPGKEGAVS